MKLCLVVGQGSHKGRLIPISLPQFLIGRDAKCHLRPASQTISKRHCELLLRDDKWYVRDCGSTNGTIVNDVTISGERELHDGDVIKLGPLDFGVKFEVQAEKPTQVEKETRAPAAAPAPAAAAHTRTPEHLDEDTIGSMLLEITDEEQASSENEDMLGSTIMDVIKPPDEESPEAKPAPYRPSNNKPASSGNTSSAAKAILEKYRRRPRS